MAKGDTTVERSEAIAKKLKEILDIACKKVGCKKEVGLCRFLPSLSGGYMHHFTFQSMKVKDPAGLAELVHKLIIFTDFPKRLMPSDRKPRARKAGKELAHLSYEQVQKVRQLARNSNEPDLLSVWLMARRAGITMEQFCGFGAAEYVGGTAHNGPDDDENEDGTAGKKKGRGPIRPAPIDKFKRIERPEKRKSK